MDFLVLTVNVRHPSDTSGYKTIGTRCMKRLMLHAATLCGFLLLIATARAGELHIGSSGGFAAAYQALAPLYEQKTGDALIITWGPSMGNTPQALPARLARGEPLDAVIMVGYALGDLIKQGTVIDGSRVDLARSGIGVVVRQGAPHPDISTVEALKQALLAAKSIAYSDSASGVYIRNEMFNKLGIADQVAGKARMIPAEPVGLVVARGEAEIGFQQISELKPIKGIDLLGPLPDEVQQYTIFSAGIVSASQHKQDAAALLHFFASTEARPAIAESGLEPMP
jgi:molybdate transport system substrate-binding protein